MNTARRAIVGGAFGALATATVAASAAFACHPISYLELSHAQGPPGMTMRVEGNGFDPGIDLEIRWADGATVTEVLGKTEVKAVDTATGRAQAAATVQIPVNAAVRDEPYTIVGTQVGASGKTFVAKKTFTVVAAAVPEQVKDPVVPSPQENNPVTPGPDPGPPVLPATLAEQTATPVAATPAANSATAGPTAAARPAATTGRTDAVASPAPATAGAPAASRTSDAAAVAPAPSAASPAAARTAAPGPDDLWSAVGAERQPSLLDAPASAPQTGGAPVGGILTGAGVLALAGAALLAGRRRLALARTR